MPDLLDRTPVDTVPSEPTAGRRTRRGLALLLALVVTAGGAMTASPAVAAPAAAVINPTQGRNWAVTLDSGVTASFSSGYQWLDKNSAWPFPNNSRARLILQDDGNLVLY